MKVDVVMCTWNSNKPYFVKCLNSIRREIPVHHFILIDRFSNDGSVKTVKEIFPKAIVKETCANLGVARQLGIRLVDTEFFVFVDDDIELCSRWFREITTHIDSATGAIHGQAVIVLRHLSKWFEWSWEKWLPYRKGPMERVQIVTAKN
ncbi:MAG: glycosyltransferase family A protein [Candidatus Bathyarchaeia archaeon]